MQAPWRRWSAAGVAGALVLAGCVHTEDKPATPIATAPSVDFNTHIRPILNENCTSCHGGVKAAGDISFVYRETATKVAKKSGRPVIVPGDPEGSELMRRITSTDADYRMPPADHGPALPADKIALLREWIKQGAEWQEHWAFVPPQPQKVPRVAAIEGSAAQSARPHPIDAFIRARLAKEGLSPSPEASRAALLRRVSLDLTGLPPTPEEVAAFEADRSREAYEKQVDRLLASPHFGERWASMWLDLARYADTKGYEKDDEREVWKYRDWVVDALNRNVPYDQFVIEQLAGDLLPDATLEQHIATSFNRQTQVNDEGGTDDEEYRIAAIIDRVATTWQVTSAVTFNCVQCHSHPYDPIRHDEYYRFFSFLNNSRDADFNNDHPTIRVADDPKRHEETWRLEQEIDALRHEVVSAGTTLASNAAQWRLLPVTHASADPAGEFKINGDEVEALGTIATKARYDLTVALPALSSGPITALRIEALPLDLEKARHTPERGFIVTRIDCVLALPDGSVQPVEVGRFFPDSENFTTTMTKVQPAPPPTADERKNATAASSRPPPKITRDITINFHFAANPTIGAPRWVIAAFDKPLVAPPGATLRVSIHHGREITSKPAPVRRLKLAASSDPRWNKLATDPEIARKAERVTDALAELAKIPGTELPVMAELSGAERRETRLFTRGSFLEKAGPALAPGVPEVFPPLPADAPRNRLTLARWFFQPGQPLTARVAVNRFWEQLFGNGLVPTLEDFGRAGAMPSHPELLDWLALRFERDLRWDMKAMLREMVLSATYRQDARATPEHLAKDPRNVLLARGPRQRLTAEMVRDQALAASGLLSRKIGGAPAMPPQPPGVWQTVYNNKDWVDSKGEERHRRALYTYWKRSAAYPSFLTFDMPSRDLCTARRIPTNTPLQALVTLNDVVFQEAAQALADRAMREAPAGVEAQIARAFELVLSRAPTTVEAARLRKLYDDTRAAEADFTPARALATVSVAILNLDAALTR